ncbi:hypothetical protein JDS87_27285 [Bacillus cereus]|uniref:hypothetical protein n=1 Tax=Bacillus cereus TaxID=1396 RepID=UPI0018F59F07|nr:hypothetical protein [Bacillus cereus]MBJ8055531.1 hypothetical protein [Bacillus cereus]
MTKTTVATNITLSPGSLDGLSVMNYDNESFAIELEQFRPEEVNMTLADIEIITSFLREHPEEMTTIVNYVLAGQTEPAREVASKIGFTAEAFQENGESILWWLMILVAAIMILIPVIYCSHHPEACRD